MEKIAFNEDVAGVLRKSFLTWMNCCNKLLMLCVWLVVCSGTTAGDYFYHASPPSHDLNWHLDKTVNGVQFFYAIAACNGKNGDVVFLKMNNKNTYAVEVLWKEVFQTQMEKVAEGRGGEKRIILQPGETFESDCNHASHKELLIIAQQAFPTYLATISKFNYKEISVKKAK
ncbi:MAG TPA: hypothetical protein VFV68_02210 [Agriterribacter sp.]|nr:hypothetical protein [Agriterribacter sp.]